MKNFMFVLSFCTLITTFGCHTDAFAMNDDIEKDPNFIALKEKCQVFPDLNTNLESWVKHYQTNLKAQEYLDQHKYAEVAQCLDSGKKMDELRPTILDLSRRLMSSLQSLKVKYTNISDEEMQNLIGIKTQYDLMAENLALFMAYSQTGFLKETNKK